MNNRRKHPNYETPNRFEDWGFAETTRTVKCRQVTEDNAAEIADQFRRNVWTVTKTNEHNPDVLFWIGEGPGALEVHDGDWIIFNHEESVTVMNEREFCLDYSVIKFV